MATAKNESEKALSDMLTVLSSKSDPAGKTASVLLLARYRYLEPDLQDLRRRFPRLTFSFKTIHASKGLEADHVVLLNAGSGRVGFPSEIVDDPLLGLVSPDEETFQNAEERRVMYVAMTRARRTLIQLLTLMAVMYAPSPSRFVQTAATTLAATALVAAVWTMMPVLAASVCN